MSESPVGLDSSALVCLLGELRDRGQLEHDFTTFSLAWPGEPIDESAYARAVIDRWQPAHEFLTPTGSALEEELDRMVVLQDEPFRKIITSDMTSEK